MTNILLMGGLGTLECAFILLLVLLCKFYFFSRKGVKDKKNVDSINSQKKSLSNELRVDIPDTCPHCKNPNTKKIRLCEWCGNQII